MSRHPRQVLTALGAIALVASQAAAQGGVTVSGRVTSETGAPLANASVFVQELSLGSVTRDDGRYSFSVPAARATGQTATLTARRVGYRASSAQVTLSGSAIEQDFVLADAPTILNTVMVTALGIEKKKSELGTAQQQLSAEELNRTRDQNILNQLSGKISGVTILSSGTQGGSTKITIRGSNSLTGNNDPLIIVDGVPISNYNRGGSPYGGYDFGSAVTDVPAEDVETFSVLKGPNAAALYGSRAANGVVLITTKKGGNTGGKISMRVNSSMSWETPSILPDYQNQYGQGSGGQFDFVTGTGTGGGVNDGTDESWGPRLDGRTTGCKFLPGTTTYNQAAPCRQFNHPTGGPWIPQPDNVRDFFETGQSIMNNVSMSGGIERASARLSVGNEQIKGIIPNNIFKKFTASFSGTLQVSNQLSATGNIQFVRNQARNRPGIGYSNGILQQFVWFGRQVDIGALRQYYDEDGNLRNWNYNYHNNPYWLQYENPLHDDRDNFIGSISATYKLLEGVNARLTTGSNIFRTGIQQNWAAGNIAFSDPAYFGAFSLFNNNHNENNTELLLSANRQLMPSIAASATLGANRRFQTYRSNSVSTRGISVPGVYNVANAAITPTNAQYFERRQVNSVYGSASATWNGWWTVEGTARNDWSSTLPEGNNSYFYPSVNTSIVLTDAIPMLRSNALTYAKLRGSVARVGSDAGPYQLQTTYVGSPTKFGTLPLFSQRDALANFDLKPEITRSGEVGLELGFFDDRASFDATYYEKATSNQIINLTVSPASGFGTKSVNAGKLEHKGWEALLSVIPVRLANGFEWTSTFNFARDRGKVVRLAGDLTTIVLGENWGATVEAKLNEPYGAIVGNAYLRDEDTGQLVLFRGRPQAGELTTLGNIQPDWTGGWNNEFKFRNFSVNALLDIKRGGEVFSVTNMFGQYSGVLSSTLRGREEEWNRPGIRLEGIDEETGQPNARTITAEQYNHALFQLHEAFIYDASYIKLRELRVGFDLPSSITGRLRVDAVSLALVGRNLWTDTDLPNIDPEFTYSTGNFQGIDYAPIPNPKSFGFNLQITP